MRALVVLFFGLAVVACVDSGAGPQPKKIDPQYVKAHVLEAPPANLERWDVPLGDAVVYLGNTVDKSRVAPGGTLTVTHYWKVNAPIDAKWKLFSILRGPANSEDFMNLPATDMELARAPSTWKPGQVIEDVQTITIRPDWHADNATLLVGLIEDGGHGPLDRMRTEGPHTLDRAVVARVLEMDLARAVRPGTIHVPRAVGPIAIDGMATDAGWAQAVTSPDFAQGEGSNESLGKAVAKMTWDDQFLYIFVAVTDPEIVAPYKKHDEEMWRADCIEMFIDADGNRSGYVELQVNPNNATFDKWYRTTRDKGDPGDLTWESKMVTAVKTKPDGYDVEVAIPWNDVKGRDDGMKVRLPPHVGDRFRLNIVRVDKKLADKEKELSWSSWNRIGNDFHGLDRMLVAIFADATGSIVESDAPPAPPPIALPAPTQATFAVPFLGDIPVDPVPAAQRLVVTVPATGSLTADGNPVLDDDLDKLFRVAVTRDKDTEVVFEVSGGPRDRLNKLVDAARRAGLSRLVIREAGAGSGN